MSSPKKSARKSIKVAKIVDSKDDDASPVFQEHNIEDDEIDNSNMLDGKPEKELTGVEEESEERHQDARKTHAALMRKKKRMSTDSIASCKSNAAKRLAASHDWFGARTEEEIQALLGLRDQKDFCAGGLVDYLERLRAAEIIRMHKTRKRGFTTTGTTQTMVDTMKEDFDRYVAEVHYERLKDTLMIMLTKFWRGKGDKKWAVQGLDCWRKHASNIVKGKQKAKCLGIDVNFYEMKYKLIRERAKGQDHQDERHLRLRDFFQQYHASQSKVDLQMPCSNGQLALVHSQHANIYKVAHSAFSDSLGRGQLETVSDASVVEQPPSDGFENTPSKAKLDPWKARTARNPQRCHTASGSMELASRLTGALSPASKMATTLPPMSPMGRRGGGLNFTLGSWDAPLQLDATVQGSCSTPSLGGSATLTGGWGLERIHYRDGRRCKTEPAAKDVDQLATTLRLGTAPTGGLRPADGLSQLKRPNTYMNTWHPSALSESSPSWHPSAPSDSGTSRGYVSQTPNYRDFLAKKGVTQRLSSLSKSMSAPLLPADDYVNGDSSLSPSLSRKERNPFVTPWGHTKATTLDKIGHSNSSPPKSPTKIKKALLITSPESPSRHEVKPTSKYLRETELNCISPKLLPFVTGHSAGLKATNQALNDCDLLVIGTMLSGSSGITEVDLRGNSLLTEKSLVPFLQKLYDEPVERFSLNRCLRHALPPGIKETLGAVESLLSDPHGLKFLKSLDLGSIAIGSRTHLPLCQAIQEHPRLTEVRMADVGLGGHTAKECITQLTRSTSIEVLDLSWNSFSADVFLTLGEKLAGMYNLLSLHLSNCSSSQSGLDNPIAYFIEYLSHNTSLTHVDLSTNRLTFRGALVLEDALDQHKRLSDITISNNPVGVLGMRCLLRLLSRDSSGLLHINADSVSGGTPMDALGENMQLYRASNPSGHYNLDLARPYHRSLLRMLYKSCERFGVSPVIAFKDISYSAAAKGGYSHQAKDADGIYPVPQSGKMSLNFDLVACEEGPLLKEVSHDDFGKFISKYEERARIKVGFKKIVPMMAYWRNLEGQHADCVSMLEALCKDFAFTGDQIEVMCHYRPMIKEVLWRLMPCIIGDAAGCFLPTRLAVNIGEYKEIYHKAFLLESFNPDHPTGHYKLNLENPSDYIVAQRLILLDRWEVTIARKLKRPDVSQKGNMSHVRNEVFQESPIQANLMEWGMPEWDTLELDYTSGKRPPAGVPSLDNNSWQALLVATQEAGCSQGWQVLAYRKVAHHLHISAIQLRQLLSIFASEELRQDVFVLFFLRLSDIANEKVCRVRFDGKKEVAELRRRLGHLVFFPYIQPEQGYFEFDFRYNDERQALVCLLTLAVKESRIGNSYSNIHDQEYWNANGTKDNLYHGIPAHWSYIDKVPTSGLFKCTYNCAPEDRKLADRKKAIEEFGFWVGPDRDDQVNWWASIGGTPDDVIEFLDFLVMNYSNVFDAFTDIDGVFGNKQICKEEFFTGLLGLKFDKFKGQRKNERITNVFRYLDPSGEGQVSLLEWSVLDSLFKEIKHSIGEFVWFLDRTFDNLEDSWVFLDDDGDGVLDFKEWMDASKSIGYFGPARPIFSYLDKDDEGTISWEEFQILSHFHEDRESHGTHCDELAVLNTRDRSHRGGEASP